MELMHKICEIYVMPPNDSKKVLGMLVNTGFLVSEVWCDNGKFKFEVFEKNPNEVGHGYNN